MPNDSMPKGDYAKSQYAKRGLCQIAVCQNAMCQKTVCQNTGEPGAWINKSFASLMSIIKTIRDVGRSHYIGWA